MKNFKQIAFGLLVGAIAISFSAFINANKSNIVKINKDANGKITSVTSFFYNKSGVSTDHNASNFVYRDATTPASCNSSSNECQAEWSTPSMPTNGETPPAGSSYVGNGIETGLYNGQ